MFCKTPIRRIFHPLPTATRSASRPRPVTKTAILPRRLARMAGMAERLVITRLNEQSPVAPVRNDVVTIRRPAHTARRCADEQRSAQASIPPGIPDRQLVPLAHLSHLLVRHPAAISLPLSFLVMPLTATTARHRHFTAASAGKLTWTLWRNRHGRIQKRKRPSRHSQGVQGTNEEKQKPPAQCKKPKALTLGFLWTQLWRC